jgi:arylsulfatase A-like enzyme
MLLEQGCSTFMVDRYHLTPSHRGTGVGPYDRWPLGRGFERDYGFLGEDQGSGIRTLFTTTIRSSSRGRPRRAIT